MRIDLKHKGLSVGGVDELTVKLSNGIHFTLKELHGALSVDCTILVSAFNPKNVGFVTGRKIIIEKEG